MWYVGPRHWLLCPTFRDTMLVSFASVRISTEHFSSWSWDNPALSKGRAPFQQWRGSKPQKNGPVIYTDVTAWKHKYLPWGRNLVFTYLWNAGQSARKQHTWESNLWGLTCLWCVLHSWLGFLSVLHNLKESKLVFQFKGSPLRGIRVLHYTVQGQYYVAFIENLFFIILLNIKRVCCLVYLLNSASMVP